MPQRLQLRRTKGWRLPPGAANVARPGRWGNPFRVDVFGRELAIALYARALAPGRWSEDGVPPELLEEARAGRDAVLAKLGPDPLARAGEELAGHDLACWCRLTEACHADVLLAAANQERSS